MHTHAYPRTPMQVPGALKPMAMHTHAYPRTPMQVPGALKLYLHSAEHDHIVDKINSSHRVNELWFGASCCAPSNFLCARPRIPPTPSSHRFSTPHPPPPYPNWPLHPTWPYIHIYMCTWTHAYTPPQASRSPRPMSNRFPPPTAPSCLHLRPIGSTDCLSSPPRLATRTCTTSHIT